MMAILEEMIESELFEAHELATLEEQMLNSMSTGTRSDDVIRAIRKLRCHQATAVVVTQE